VSRAPLAAGPICPVLLLSACFNTPSPLNPNLQGSVGVPNNGVQTGAVELPQRGPGFVRFRPKSPHYWGRPRLVGGLMDVARSVGELRPGTPRLVVGDLSAKYGGKISGHNSHRSGRDVDLLFYVTTPSGAPLETPGFIRIAGDGLGQLESGEFVRLDVERQWLLIKLLLASPELGVQFMFVSREIEALLIDYARSRGDDLMTIWQAETVMLEPRDSLPHDDHIHLRVACTPEEAVAGCTGGGPYWEWLEPWGRLEPVSEELLLEIAAEDPVGAPVVAQGDERAGGGA
jgi:penicillin-insensitive murein endopeptidase